MKSKYAVDWQKNEEVSGYRKLTTHYARNIWFGQGVVASHITARMIKENPESEAFYKTLDFIVRIDQPYIDKNNIKKIQSQSVKIVVISKKFINYILEKELIRGDIVSIQGMLVTKELSKQTGYNRTQYIEVNNILEHNVEIIVKSKINQKFEVFELK